MRFSFAQNFEDVLLNRCFCDLSTGFYVDVGAAAPAMHSVSLNFYLKGWRGLNVEPIPERAQELRWARPRDIIVETAASDHVGRAVLNRTAGAGGLSSLTSEFLGARGATNDIWPIEVQTRTLSDIFVEHGVETLQFLKIDVEGAEDRVLSGLDLQRWRPIVLVIEAVTPTRPPRPNFDVWEGSVVASGFTFVYFDGLNRYYLRNESLELSRHFTVPPCVFDPIQRFEDFGEPLFNRTHPSHEFALRTSKVLLRCLASGALDPLAVFLRDLAPNFLDGPASPGHGQWAIRQILAREPRAGEAEGLIDGRDLTVRQMLGEIFVSDEFRTACACAAV